MLQICHLNGIVSSAEESRENFGASVNIEWFGMDRREGGKGKLVGEKSMIEFRFARFGKRERTVPVFAPRFEIKRRRKTVDNAWKNRGHTYVAG